MDMAAAAGFRGVLGAAARDAFARAASEGLALHDDSVLLRWIEARQDAAHEPGPDGPVPDAGDPGH
jgi:hypothetical protein